MILTFNLDRIQKHNILVFFLKLKLYFKIYQSYKKNTVRNKFIKIKLENVLT